MHFLIVKNVRYHIYVLTFLWGPEKMMNLEEAKEHETKYKHLTLTGLTKINDYDTMTIVMNTLQTVSKSQLKSQLLEYLREVERTKQPLVITHQGKAVAKITPYKEDTEELLKSLIIAAI